MFSEHRHPARASVLSVQGPGSQKPTGRAHHRKEASGPNFRQRARAATQLDLPIEGVPASASSMRRRHRWLRPGAESLRCKDPACDSLR